MVLRRGCVILGYYANGSGQIVFSSALSYAASWKVKDILDRTLFEFDYDGVKAFDIWCYCKYHEDEVESALEEISEVAKLQAGYIEYCGEDDAHWRFKFSPKKGKWCVQNGRVVYDGDTTVQKQQNKDNKIVIPLPNGYQLVAERNTDPSYNREIFIGITDGNGVWWQDLAVVRNAYEIMDNLKTKWKDNEFEVLVYGKEDDEDYTESFVVGLYHDSEEERS